MLILLTSQFRDQSFTPGSTAIGAGGIDDYFTGEVTIGDYFRIKYPKKWKDADMYSFDWSVLKKEKIRFEKFNYNVI